MTPTNFKYYQKTKGIGLNWNRKGKPFPVIEKIITKPNLETIRLFTNGHLYDMLSTIVCEVDGVKIDIGTVYAHHFTSASYEKFCQSLYRLLEEKYMVDAETEEHIYKQLESLAKRLEAIPRPPVRYFPPQG